MRAIALTVALSLLAATFLQCGDLATPIEKPTQAPPPTSSPTPVIPTPTPLPKPTSTPVLDASYEDVQYLMCVQEVAEDSRDLLTDMHIAANSGDVVAFCAKQPTWAERAAAAHTKHAGCRFPTNENLRNAYDYVNQALAEMVDGVDACRELCGDLGSSYWAQRVVDHMQRTGVYLNLANEEIEKASF